jgi:hypothetical protein
MKRIKSLAQRLSLVAGFALVAAGLGSCSGGGVGLPPLQVVAFNFAPGFAGVRLNSPLEITFSAPVDEMTVNQDSIRIFTTTTTTEQPDPGAPAIGEFIVAGNVVRFLPAIPQAIAAQVLSDSGLRIGFTYTIQIPASPDVIEPVRTTEGKPNVVSYAEFFTTLNQTILPAPGDIPADPNLNSLQLFFIDEGIENGVDPCPRSAMAPADQDSPQVIRTDPQEGESGFGTITGIQAGLGTAFVRLDPITIDFSEPVGPWRIREQNVSIRNTNLGGETFDLFFFFRQDRDLSRLEITVFDADSAFDQASVPQGRYVLSLTQFSDLAGNLLVNSNTCVADGTFDLSFSTVSSPTLPTDLKLTFQDDDGDGHVDVGGLATGNNDPNAFPEHVSPMLGGFAIDHVAIPSPSRVTSDANWGDTAFWTGAEMRYDNGYDPADPTYAIPDALRLRGSGSRAATAILSPLAGRATGRSDPLGSLDGTVTSTEPGKVDFVLNGNATAELFTGDASTGPIVYHYNEFTLTEDTTTLARPLLRHRKLGSGDSLFPLVIFVEDNALITGDIVVDGTDGDHGFNGANDGTTSFTPGGVGGLGGPGGGDGGRGGAADFTGDLTDPEKFNGQTGQVCANVIGPLDEFSEAMAGITGMITGGGGHFDQTQDKDPGGTGSATVTPAFSGGGGGGPAEAGANGGDFGTATPGETDQGVGGQQVGTDATGFFEEDIFATGGAGGGGGSGDDDGGGDGTLADGVLGLNDDGGGGGGGGGGFFGLACAFDVVLGVQPPESSNTENFTTGGTTPEVYTLGTTLTDLEAIDSTSLVVTLNGAPLTVGVDFTFDGGTNELTLLATNTAGDTLQVTYDYSRLSQYAVIRAVGGRGGSTYQFSASTTARIPADAMLNPDPTGPIGQGEAGGGGGGGGICVLAGGDLAFVALVTFVHGKTGGNDINIENGTRNALDSGGSGGAGKWVFGDQDGIDVQGEIIDATTVIIDPQDATLDTDPKIPATVGGTEDRTGMVGLPSLAAVTYGNGPREPGFATSQIVSEFFDTLSDSVSYDEVRVLSNAPSFPYDAGSAVGRTIRVIVDTAVTGAGGLPDFTAEDASGGFTGDPTFGFTHEIDLDFDANGDPTAPPGTASSESRTFIPAGSQSLGKRFVRVRIIFDLSRIGSPDDLLGNPGGTAGLGFALPGAADVIISPGNTLGNLDTAPEGVPAVAEVRVRFTP